MVTSTQNGTAAAPSASRPVSWAQLLVRLSPALLSVFADFFGLASLMPLLVFHLEDCGAADVALWTGVISSCQFAAVCISCVGWGVAA